MTSSKQRRRGWIDSFRAILVAIVLVAVSVGVGAQSTQFTPESLVEGEFLASCRRLTEGDNGYFGAAVAGKLRHALEQGDQPPSAVAKIRARLGWELFKLGELTAASIELAAAQKLFNELNDPELDAVERRVKKIHAALYLQQGERQNCIADQRATSCIWPISSEAIHQAPEAAKLAAGIYLDYIEEYGADPDIRWLLNVAQTIAGNYPDGVPALHRIPPDLGEESDFRRWRNIAIELELGSPDIAGGALIEDLDNDGFLDIISTSWHPCEPMKAFRNDGRGGFTDVTSEWGLDHQLGGLNLLQADYDNDGMLDILVLRGAWLGDQGRVRNSLLRNDLRRESGRFVDTTSAAGIAYPAYPTQTAAWADFDLDGDLDLYVGNEASFSNADPLALVGSRGTAYPSQLFRNNGDGTFSDVARAAGVANDRFTKGVAWGDYDDDGDPDLYISAFGQNRLYQNQGDSKFIDVAPELGLTEPLGSFGTWFFDYDNDSDLDLFVADFSTPMPRMAQALAGEPVEEGHPVLYRNDGGTFTDVSTAVGFTSPQLPMGANYGDLDGDGFLDIYLGTGLPEFSALMPNAMYRNQHGRDFEDVTAAGGFGHLQKGHGIAFADLDNDGDQDLFEQLGGAFPYDRYANVLYENPGSGASWLVLYLEGTTSNRSAIGARVTVRTREVDGERSFHRLVGSGGSFGASTLRLEIGLGAAEAVEEVAIRWPGRAELEIHDQVGLNRAYRALEGRPTLEAVTLRSTRQPLDSKP